MRTLRHLCGCFNLGFLVCQKFLLRLLLWINAKRCKGLLKLPSQMFDIIDGTSWKRTWKTKRIYSIWNHQKIIIELSLWFSNRSQDWLFEDSWTPMIYTYELVGNEWLRVFFDQRWSLSLWNDKKGRQLKDPYDKRGRLILTHTVHINLILHIFTQC